MNLYIYSDESGVFDKKTNDFFVFAGILFTSRDDRNKLKSKYLTLEKSIKYDKEISPKEELKASNLANKTKKRLYSYLKDVIKFSVIIDLRKLYDYKGKDNKQRYLDYAFKIGLKRTLKKLEKNNILKLNEIERIFIECDEHTIATSGIYDLRDTIYNEFKYGVVNFNHNAQYGAIIPDLVDVEVKYLDSKNNALIRCADIVSNFVYTSYRDFNIARIEKLNNEVYIELLP
ncbi:DUF3800 domain-containing protein [Oceanivirga miroungae]|uniref:DUF3800 domain-containing protein n=1 Tax=Oceanivirga miroungae TaxID=1130046 RepID=A0A6I8MBM7_9FUSO|nr:DUF3800 domain-containing protein [Oceanivirga miroungae]VWL85601.1 hypothetical protein OMES3154_00887 [Oceanivirga miroungae]